MPCPQTKKSNAKTPRESPKAEASADSNAAPAMTLSVRCSYMLIILEAIVILLLNTPSLSTSSDCTRLRAHSAGG